VGGNGEWIKASEDRVLAKFFTPAPKPEAPGAHAISAGSGAQVVTIQNTIAPPPAPTPARPAPPPPIGEKPADKSPWAAAILSLLIAGLGQLYNGEIGKGIVMFFVLVIFVGITAPTMDAAGSDTGFGLWLIVNIVAAIDGYIVAKRKREHYQRWMAADAAARGHVSE